MHLISISLPRCYQGTGEPGSGCAIVLSRMNCVMHITWPVVVTEMVDRRDVEKNRDLWCIRDWKHSWIQFSQKGFSCNWYIGYGVSFIECQSGSISYKKKHLQCILIPVKASADLTGLIVKLGEYWEEFDYTHSSLGGVSHAKWVLAGVMTILCPWNSSIQTRHTNYEVWSVLSAVFRKGFETDFKIVKIYIGTVAKQKSVVSIMVWDQVIVSSFCCFFPSHKIIERGRHPILPWTSHIMRFSCVRTIVF